MSSNAKMSSNPDEVPLGEFYLDCSKIKLRYKFKEVPEFPTSIQNLGIEEEIRQLMKDIDEFFLTCSKHARSMAGCALLSLGFCIPCALCYYMPTYLKYNLELTGETELDRIIQEFNAKSDPKGYHVAMRLHNAGYYKYNTTKFPYNPTNGLIVKMSVSKRKEYCEAMGIPFTFELSQSGFETEIESVSTWNCFACLG